MIKTASICFMDGFPMALLMTFLLKMGISERSQREKLTIMFFDIEQNIEDQYPVLVRGIISISDAEQDFRYTMWLALILFPLLIFLTAICGYLLSRRALYPVAKITKTVQDIQTGKGFIQTKFTLRMAATKFIHLLKPLMDYLIRLMQECSGKSSSPMTLPTS